MNASDAEEYTQALDQVVTGGWRLVLHAERLGVPKALGLTTRQWGARIGGHVRLSIEDRREAVAELTEGEGLSNRATADVLGIGEATVRRDKDEGAPNDANEQGEQGELGDGDAPNDAPKKPHVAQATGESEWYTPKEYIGVARRVLGEIDLDPASTAEANAVVGATHYHTIESDGLSQGWAGRVWLNPPYASGLVDKFAAKICGHVDDGSVEAAIVLVNNATETAWFQRMAKRATAICFPAQRIKFWGPGGEAGAPLQGQAVIYLGDNYSVFRERFEPFGLMVYAQP